MGQKRQISHAEEFQSIYVDIPPKRGGTRLLLLGGVPIGTSFQGRQYGKGVKRGT